jgi:hypothetical protein
MSDIQNTAQPRAIGGGRIRLYREAATCPTLTSISFHAGRSLRRVRAGVAAGEIAIGDPVEKIKEWGGRDARKCHEHRKALVAKQTRRANGGPFIKPSAA